MLRLQPGRAEGVLCDDLVSQFRFTGNHSKCFFRLVQVVARSSGNMRVSPTIETKFASPLHRGTTTFVICRTVMITTNDKYQMTNIKSQISNREWSVYFHKYSNCNVEPGGWSVLCESSPPTSVDVSRSRIEPRRGLGGVTTCGSPLIPASSAVPFNAAS